jgi:branched-chain amino acid transport system permease protein
MAMFTTFIAWSVWNGHAGVWWYWAAFFITLLVALGFGGLVELTIIRPVERGPVLNPIIVTLGLFTVVNSIALRIWGGQPKAFPVAGVFQGAPLRLGPAVISRPNIGVFCMSLVMMALIYVFFSYTKVGLAMRATAQNRVASQLVGIRVGRMLVLGWALSAAVGSVAGMLLAPTLFLSPGMMQGVLLFAFAAAVLGGLESPAGAIVGGLSFGVIQTMAGTYVGSNIDITVAFFVIIVVLLVRPRGLFGRQVVQRV